MSPFLLIVIAIKGHHVVIEADQGGLIEYRKVLGTAENLDKAFGPGKVEIEIVCRGDALGMLVAAHTPVKRELGLAVQHGIQFAACGNTMRAWKLTRAALVPYAKVVDAGVAEIVRREEAGWSYLKI